MYKAKQTPLFRKNESKQAIQHNPEIAKFISGEHVPNSQTMGQQNYMV